MAKKHPIKEPPSTSIASTRDAPDPAADDTRKLVENLSKLQNVREELGVATAQRDAALDEVDDLRVRLGAAESALKQAKLASGMSAADLSKLFEIRANLEFKTTLNSSRIQVSSRRGARAFADFESLLAWLRGK